MYGLIKKGGVRTGNYFGRKGSRLIETRFAFRANLRSKKATKGNGENNGSPNVEVNPTTVINIVSMPLMP